MNITIKATNHEMTLGMRGLIEEKFSALEKFAADGALTCEVEQSIAVERAGAKYHAEGNLSANGKLYRASAESSTLEGAVDRVRDDLVREVQSAHGKQRGLVRQGGAAIKRLLRFGR